MDCNTRLVLKGLGTSFTITGLGILHNVPPDNLSNLHCLNAQAQRGLVSNAGDHGDTVIAHLVEIGIIRIGDRPDKGDTVGLGAEIGGVGDGISDLC